MGGPRPPDLSYFISNPTNCNIVFPAHFSEKSKSQTHILRMLIVPIHLWWPTGAGGPTHKATSDVPRRAPH